MRRSLMILVLLLSLTTAAWPTASVFDGANSKVAIPHVAALAPAQMTVCVWTYRTGNGEADLGRIWDKSSHALFVMDTGTTYMFRVFSGFEPDGFWRIDIPSANAWHHLCLAYDTGSTTNDPVVYYDGVSQTVTESQTPVGTYADSGNPWNWGNDNGSTRTWTGSLASAALYNVLLTAGEVRTVMHKGPQCVRRGLVGYWPLGLFGGRNYTSTANLAGTETSITVSSAGPPVSVAQGGLCE